MKEGNVESENNLSEAGEPSEASKISISRYKDSFAQSNSDNFQGIPLLSQSTKMSKSSKIRNQSDTIHLLPSNQPEVEEVEVSPESNLEVIRNRPFRRSITEDMVVSTTAVLSEYPVSFSRSAEETGTGVEGIEAQVCRLPCVVKQIVQNRQMKRKMMYFKLEEKYPLQLASSDDVLLYQLQSSSLKGQNSSSQFYYIRQTESSETSPEPVPETSLFTRFRTMDLRHTSKVAYWMLLPSVTQLVREQFVGFS